jgi:hypothetical protein
MRMKDLIYIRKLCLTTEYISSAYLVLTCQAGRYNFFFLELGEKYEEKKY